MKKLIYLAILCLFLSCFLKVSAIDAHTPLIKLPDCRENGIDIKTDPFIKAIDSATNTLILATYKLHKKKLPEPHFLKALKRAVQRGVDVTVLAEDKLTEIENVLGNKAVKEGDALKAYKKVGAKVVFHKKDFNQIHTKYIVVDHKLTLVGTTNFDKDFHVKEEEGSDKRPSRDFSIVTRDPEIIKELEAVFYADTRGEDYNPSCKKLYWGPNGLREKIEKLINSATKSIKIYQQDITDQQLVGVLARAAKKGVHIELLMSPHPFGMNKPDNNVPHKKHLKEVGVSVYDTKVITHAKILIIDDRLMYLSSCNFYQPAIDESRNVGLLVEDPSILKQILVVFDQDKKNAERF